LRLIASRRAWQRSNVGELNIGIGGDCLRYASEDQQQCGVVIAAAHERHCLALEASDFAIRKNWFEPVADFDARTMILDDVKDEHAAIRPFTSDPPLLEEIDRVALDVAALERVDGYERDLRVGLGVELLGDVRDLRGRLRIQDVREIVDVIGGLELRDRLRKTCETQRDNEQE
jgi:hypothetical protein